MLSNDIDVKIGVDYLLDELGCYGINFSSLSCLHYGNRLGPDLIDNVLDLFLFEYSLNQIGLLRPILEAMEFFMLWPPTVRVCGHYNVKKRELR